MTPVITISEIKLQAAWSAALALIQLLSRGADLAVPLDSLRTALHLHRVHPEQWKEAGLPDYVLPLQSVVEALSANPDADMLEQIKPSLQKGLKYAVEQIALAHPGEFNMGVARDVFERAGI